MGAVKRLLKHPLCKTVAFHRATKCFVRTVSPGNTRKRCRGLLDTLGKAFRVTEHTAGDCARCKWLGRRSPTDSVRAAAFARASKRRQRQGHVVPVAGHTAMTTPAVCLGATGLEHGHIVDTDICRHVQSGRPVRDPCSRRLLEYVRTVLGWLPVAAQVPVYSPALGVATAIDLVCTDAATRTKLYVVEVKSTRQRAASRAMLDACYRTSAGVAGGGKRTTDPWVRQLAMSQYMQHQLQLWAMAHVVQQEMGIAIDQAVVLRTTRNHGVHVYPLDAQLPLHADGLVARFTAIGRKRG